MSRGISFAGLRIEPLRVRVDRNRIRYVVFLVTFVTGSAALLSLAFVAVPGTLLRPLFDVSDYFSWLWLVVAGAFGVLLVAGAIAVYSQVSNAEHWVSARFRSVPFDAGTHLNLRRAVEEMAIAGGLPEPPRLLLFDVPSVNACAIGASRKRPLIGVTRGFLDSLTAEEQQAVIATLVARITRGDILVATALAALMGPLRMLRNPDTGAAGLEALADAGCRGCGNVGDFSPTGCLGALLGMIFLMIVATVTWIAIMIAAWLVTVWGRALHRTGHEKADAEGMLLLRDPGPMLSALRKAISSSNQIADGDPSYDGIFYASTSGRPGIEAVERRRYDRLREVLGVEGLAAELPEPGDETAEAEGVRLADLLDPKVFRGLVPDKTFTAGAKIAADGQVNVLKQSETRLRSKVAGERSSLATFWVESGRLQWSCTCGSAATELCEHLVASAVAAWPGNAPGEARRRTPEAPRHTPSKGEPRLVDLVDPIVSGHVLPAATFAAGVEIATDHHVETLEEDVTCLRSRVRGEQSHETKLWVEGGELRWSCTCGAADTELCEHLVASAAKVWPPALPAKRRRRRRPADPGVCRSCGAHLVDGAHFCGECGAPVSAAQQRARKAAHRRRPPERPDGKQREEG